jgi:charged multivesicular body protein 1
MRDHCTFSSQTIEDTLGAATTLSTPQDQVESLIRQVAAENDLEITDAISDLQPGQSSLASEASAATASSHAKEDQLARRYWEGSLGVGK